MRRAVDPSPAAVRPLPAPAPTGRVHVVARRRRWLVLPAAALAILDAIAAAGLVPGKSSASAATGSASASAPAPAATGTKHFIHIGTHGAPLWHAEATLYDGDGNEVYHWRTHAPFGWKSGGSALWYFTYYGAGGSVDVHLVGDNIGKSKINETGLSLDRDHCFLVHTAGNTEYTGDSLTSTCTST
jgi:hypothetical protein